MLADWFPNQVDWVLVEVRRKEEGEGKVGSLVIIMIITLINFIFILIIFIFILIIIIMIYMMPWVVEVRRKEKVKQGARCQLPVSMTLLS